MLLADRLAISRKTAVTDTGFTKSDLSELLLFYPVLHFEIRYIINRFFRINE